MGLDNGLVLKCRHKIKDEDIPSYVKIERWNEECEYNEETGEIKPKNAVDYDIAYWRKCWNIRDIILGYCENENTEQWVFDITPENLIKVQDELIEIIKDPTKWDDNETIWTFEEQKNALIQQIINITWVVKYIKEHGDCYVVFYDSY